jgi:cell division protein FtsN
VYRVTRKKLKNFMKKMHDEGSEGFAAGSWPGSEDSTDPIPPVVTRRPRWPSANSIVATLALALIVTGVVGAYLSNKSKREAVASRIDSIVRAPIRNPDVGRLQDLEARLANSLTPYEKRLRDLEQNLTQTRSFYDERLEELEQRLTHVGDPYEERLNKLENMLVSASDPYKEKLHGIEQRLVHTTNRLDELSAVMASLTTSAEAIIAANVAVMADPPAALPIKPTVVSRDNVALPQPTPKPEPAAQAVAMKIPGEPLADLPVPGKTGPWVINIGSYAKEPIAIRKQAVFLDKGVATERVAASVGGRTLYRVHVAGFDSRKEASAHAKTVEQRLGLKETWIKRR